jgi:hypothetical protein
MANDLTASRSALWSRRMQMTQHKTPIYQALANTEEQEALKVGFTVHRPYRSRMGVNDLASDGTYTIQDIKDTDEYLTIDQEKEVSFQVKDDDKLFNKYENLSALGNSYADDQSRTLNNYIDGVFIKNGVDASVGSLTAVTLSTTNVVEQFTNSMQRLAEQSYRNDLMDAWAILSPAYYNTLLQAIGGRATVLGDSLHKNGFMREEFGFKIHRSMSNPTSHVLSLATQPTANDTVTYDGVVFTFVSSIGTTAGNVLIGANVDATRANLATLINAPGTTTSTGVALDKTNGTFSSPSSYEKFKGYVSATNNNTADTLTITKIGGNRVTVSETLTDATDTWTVSSQLQYNLFGFGKPTDIVLKKAPKVEIKDVSGKTAKDFVAWTCYGMKTFSEGATHLVKAPIITSAM